MAIKFVDRVPTYPNRIKFTAEDGTVKYGVWERADSPTVVGTPINAANLNAMQQNTGLSGDVVLHVATTGSDNTGNGTSSSPYATITKALDMVPKHLNRYTATINIAAGTYYEDITIGGYTGGNIVLTGTSGDNISISTLRITETDFVQVSNIQLTLTGGAINGSLYVRNSNLAVWTTVTISGENSRGIYCPLGGNVYIYSAVISNKTDAVYVEQYSCVHFSTISGSSNTTGIRANNGAKVTYGVNSLVATVATATAAGGRIYTGAQTSIPNY